MNFVFNCKWSVAFAVLLLAVVLTGCGGVNAGGGASPATFFLPGMAGKDGRSEGHSPDRLPFTVDSAASTVSNPFPVFFREAPFERVAETDPS